MLHVKPREELPRLLGLISEGALNPADHCRLERILIEDTNARTIYQDYVCIHAMLHWRWHKRALQDSGSQFPPQGEIVANTPILGFLGNGARWTRDYFSQPGPFSILAAAIFMVCVILILMILPAPTYQPSRSKHICTTASSTGFQPVSKDGKLNFVARITSLHNCRWSAEGRAPYGFDHMAVGRELKLDAGLLEITYYNGAKVVLEGPVEFTVEKANACRLDVGKLAAKVPKPAAGFTVETPTATIVDLGTEFAVEVTDAGPTEVYAFAGEIVVQCTAVNGVGTTAQRLKAGQAVRIDGSDGSGLQAIKLNERRFMREMSIAAIAKKAASSAVAASTFDLDTEGWTVTADGSSITHHTTGGISGGYIQTTDLSKGDIYYFVAPRAFYGDRSEACGAHLAFDMLIRYVGKPYDEWSLMNGTDAIYVTYGHGKRIGAVVITGGGKKIGASLPFTPKVNRWTHYSIPLSASGNWYHVDRPDLPPASEQDITEVLGDIKELKIRGEFIDGKDATSLDNVILQEAR